MAALHHNGADGSLSVPSRAMVLAAGLGKRMLPITETLPKPLVRVHGKSLLDHGLDALARAGVSEAVVNIHYLADLVEAHVAGRTSPKVILSDERDALLDSGGGVVRALPHLGNEPFFVLNADSFWIEGYRPNLINLARHFNPQTMDIMLLVSTMGSAIGYDGRGDFTMDPCGVLTRRDERSVAPFAYAGAAIMKPELFVDAPDGAFSLNRIFDKALERGRLFGLRLEGLWLHVGTPAAIREAEDAIARSAA
ncbi:MAG: nucleotidyltransferase family protein [Nitratireductor sp.]